MRALEPGREYPATVAGFLPGRRVILDIGGDTYLAWTDLPLIRGSRIRTRAERAKGGICLKLLDQEDHSGDRDHSSHAGADELDRLIEAVATEGGRKPAAEVVNQIRYCLRWADSRLDNEAVPLTKIEKTVHTVVTLFQRRVPVRPRTLRALETCEEARLGTTLAHLESSLLQTADSIEGPRAITMENLAREAARFFHPIRSDRATFCLEPIVRKAGYLLESDLTALGRHDWRSVEDFRERSLKAFLLLSRSELTVFRSCTSPGLGEKGRRILERAVAWCNRSLEVLEGLQILNLPTTDGSKVTPTYQIPATLNGRRATLHLIVSPERYRFWLDRGSKDPVGAQVELNGNHFAVQVFGEAESAWELEATKSSHRFDATVTVESAGEESFIDLGRSLPDRRLNLEV